MTNKFLSRLVQMVPYLTKQNFTSQKHYLSTGISEISITNSAYLGSKVGTHAALAKAEWHELLIRHSSVMPPGGRDTVFSRYIWKNYLLLWLWLFVNVIHMSMYNYPIIVIVLWVLFYAVNVFVWTIKLY